MVVNPTYFIYLNIHENKRLGSEKIWWKTAFWAHINRLTNNNNLTHLNYQ